MAKKEPYYEPSAFPAFDFGHVFPPKITSAKVKSAEIRGALSAAIYLASQIEMAQGSIHLRVEPIRSAYFRAALSELVRTEDIAIASNKHFKFIETRDPLLHTIKLLRNYQVHFGNFRLEGGSIAVQHGNEQGIYESFIVDNLSAKELRKLNSATKYTDEQLEELLSLFDIHQRKFGVVQLLYNSCLHVGVLIEKS